MEEHKEEGRGENIEEGEQTLEEFIRERGKYIFSINFHTRILS
jgi:hypothetical protein